MSISGLSGATPQNLLLDAGAFYKNFDPATDTPSSAAAKCLGATAGGGSFNAVPSVRQVEVDGGKTNIKDLMFIDGWDVTMVANVKEQTLNNLKLALGAVSSTTDTNYEVITAKEAFASTDYCDISWVGTLKGKNKPVVITLNNAISTNGLNLTFEDKNEATVAITLTGCYDLDDLDDVPFAIYYPKQ